MEGADSAAQVWSHGGTDALGIPAHDFSTNRNACGPCPEVVQALQAAHVAQYPDPLYTELRAQLAAFHGVDVERLLIGGSSSELIHRLTQHAARQGVRQVSLPQHHYGDYAQAAQLWGLARVPRSAAGAGVADDRVDDGGRVDAQPCLHWACEPSSPLGQTEDIWPLWPQGAEQGGRHGRGGHGWSGSHWHVLDCAYRPLWLEGEAPERDMEALWQLWTPNKALGMTGVRGAYAIAPRLQGASDLHHMKALRQLAPSWVVGAHGVAMLEAWVQPAVQQWLAHSRQVLRDWKAQQLALCQRLGWQVLPGHQANYGVADLGLNAEHFAALLQALRAQGIKLRDCASFGLPGHVRWGVLPPQSQAALEQAVRDWMEDTACVSR